MSLDRLLQQLVDGSGMSWKDESYDYLSAKMLPPGDRGVYVAKLLELGEQGDTHAIMTLGYMEATEALPKLREWASRGATPIAATARRVLVLFGKGEEFITQIAADALEAPGRFKIAAVMDLATIGGDVAKSTLHQVMLTDQDSTVRSIAFDAVLAARDLTRRLVGPDGLKSLHSELALMGVFLHQDVPALAKLGATRIQEIFQRLDGGATPDELGIATQPKKHEDVFQEIRDVLFEPEKPFPLHLVEPLTGIDRQWCEAMIVFRLEKSDERVPDALVKLGAKWLAPALAEIAEAEEPALPPALRDKIADAARELAGEPPVARAPRPPEPAVTIIASFGKELEALEAIRPDERKERCGGWKELPVRSGLYVDAFLLKATGSDLRVFAPDDRTRMIPHRDMLEVMPLLESLVEQKSEETIRALAKHGGGRPALAPIREALRTGTLSESGDPAEEAAAFAFHLLKLARIASEFGSLIWEYRGNVKA